MYNNKYFNIYFLFFSILFLSSVVFLYDEEKIVALCLLSFVTILYYNFHEIIFNALNEESLILKKELVDLFSAKIIIMKKLRYSWRIFLDIEDLIVDMYCWIKTKFQIIIKTKNKKRLTFFWKYIIRKDINSLFQSKIIIQENLTNLILALLKTKVLQSKILQLNSLNNLKNLSFNYTTKHIVLAKLNKNILNSNNNLNYNTYFYLKWIF